MNPNNCSTCDHKQRPDGGHCYMFRDEPTDVCHRHTAPTTADLGLNLTAETATNFLDFGLDLTSWWPKSAKGIPSEGVFKSGGGGDFGGAGAGGSWDLPDVGEHVSSVLTTASEAGSSALNMVITAGSGTVEVLGSVAEGAGSVIGGIAEGAGDILGSLGDL